MFSLTGHKLQAAAAFAACSSPRPRTEPQILSESWRVRLWESLDDLQEHRHGDENEQEGDVEPTYGRHQSPYRRDKGLCDAKRELVDLVLGVGLDEAEDRPDEQAEHEGDDDQLEYECHVRLRDYREFGSAGTWAIAGSPRPVPHLRVLRDKGFATVLAIGTRRLYTVDPGPLREIDVWLARIA